MTKIKATAVGKTCCGESPSVVTAAGMAKTPPPTIAFTNDTIVSIVEDFFDPATPATEEEEEEEEEVLLCSGNGRNEAGVRCCGPCRYSSGSSGIRTEDATKDEEEDEGVVVLRSESQTPARLGTNHGGWTRFRTSLLSSTHWAL